MEQQMRLIKEEESKSQLLNLEKQIACILKENNRSREEV
jgi:hypothetical protein